MNMMRTTTSTTKIFKVAKNRGVSRIWMEGAFLSQKGIVKGFNKVIFSGLPTVEISRIIQDFVLPNKNLDGIYHLSAEPINKFDLLKLIAETYKKEIQITKDSSISINRALDSTIFRNLTGFKPLSWPNLIQKMYEFK